MNGKLCIYDDIKPYLEATKQIHGKRDSVFLSINYGFKKADSYSFFKNPNLGEQNLARYIRQVCEKLAISVEGLRDSFSMHRLRATAISNRFEAGLEAEPLSMQTGHRQPQFLK